MTASTDTIPSWTQGSSSGYLAWSGCRLGSTVLPGGIEVEGFDREQDVDIKKSQGKDGATLEDKGRTPAKGTIKSSFTARMWAAWVVILRELDPQKPGALREPREIVHPIPNVNGVTAVYVRKISVQQPKAGGFGLITLDCLEWMPPAKTTKQGKTVKPADEFVAAVGGINEGNAQNIADALLFESAFGFDDTRSGATKDAAEERAREKSEFEETIPATPGNVTNNPFSTG